MAAWIAGSTTAPVAMDSLEITIVVDRLRSAQGQVRVALWAGPEGFIDADAAIVKAVQPAQAGTMRFSIPGMAPGRYAVASYHDENGNGEFDQTWIGLPDEGLGFSNGAWIGLGPPSFEEAEVEITETQSIIKVSLRYPSSAPNRTPARSRARALPDLTGSFDGPERLIRSGAARSAMWDIGQAPQRSR